MNDVASPRDHAGTEEYEDRVRRRAYRLWESSGWPDGRADEFWSHAQALIAEEEIRPPVAVAMAAEVSPPHQGGAPAASMKAASAKPKIVKAEAAAPAKAKKHSARKTKG